MMQNQNRLLPSLPLRSALRQEIKMEVVFGTPSQNCIGSGVCMVMSRLPRAQVLPCPHAPAWISYQPGRLVFRFQKTEVLREDSIRRFSTPFFLVNEAFYLPRIAARQLGLPSSCVPPGVYALEQTAKDWIIAFNFQH